MPEYWVSSLKMTVGVTTDKNGMILSAAPVVKKFVGQPLENLTRWMRRQGGLKIVQLDEGS